MKNTVSTVFTAALGGVAALAASHFISDSETGFSQVTHPEKAQIRLANYSASADQNLTDFTMAAEKSVNSVVHIKTISQQVNNLAYDPFAELFFGPQRRQQNFEQHGSGSGVIISHDGYIVTNNHVVAGADKIEVTLNDKRTYEAELVGTDPSTDVALLRIKEKNLPFLAYGNSDIVKVGEWALAVGNPFNLNSTVTAGIISAKGRNNILSGNKRPIESFIQTDAAVNPGNSGGALVNTNGDLIGINTAIASNNGTYQGYSFAVPVNIVKKVVSDLVEFGTVQRAYIGVGIHDIDAKFASEKKLNRLNGIYVTGITEGGSADEAGIREGDVIVNVHEVPVGSVSELQEQISRYRPGDKISVTVLRNDKEINLPVVLKTFDNTTKLVSKSELVKKSVDALGAEFQELDSEELAKMRLEYGVKINRLNPGKLAQIGIQPGFIVTSIDKKKIVTADDIKTALAGKTGVVVIEGYYPNGMRAAYSFGL
jgi:serine protease Do